MTNAVKCLLHKFLIAAGIFPPILLIVATYAECNRTIFVILIILTAGFMGAYYPGMRVNTLDLAPNYAGILLAYTNGIGSNGSFIFPGITGMIITNVRQKNILTLTNHMHYPN